jgi:hypothetical protein
MARSPHDRPLGIAGHGPTLVALAASLAPTHPGPALLAQTTVAYRFN